MIVNILEMWGLKQRRTEDLTDHVVASESEPGLWLSLLDQGTFFTKVFLRLIYLLFMWLQKVLVVALEIFRLSCCMDVGSSVVANGI